MVCHFFQKRMHAPDFGRLLVELCRRKNTEMMEHLETKRGTSPKTEVDQPLVKNPKEPAWTLIGAIEQIVNLAIELKLETPFSEKAHSALTYVSECMSLDEEQALAFALFMEKSTDPRIQISDFSDLIGCRTVRIISLMAAADRLAQRHLIWRLKKENTLFYSVPMEVVEAVKENRAFEPAPIDNLTVEQLFDRMEKILDRMKEDRNLLLADLDALVAANPELPFCQTLQTYDLSENVERLLFYVFCHLYVNKGKAYLRMRDWQDYFTGDEQRFLSWMMNASDLKLCERKIIEPYNANGLEDPEYFHLTRTAREALFVGLRYVEHKSRKGRDLLDCTTFAAKELFYNPSVQRQIDRLGELLAPEHFTDIQQRLEAGGMRKGFACLFYGAPGTGKTETVYQLARRTGRDLMVVDVSQIKSCWVGESEKNIKEAFDRYRAYTRYSKPAPILLFNEADAVLGIRQEGASQAVEKMENSIQNIILQEMEQLDGILIATTNLTQNLDRAFERRFLYKIEFEKPSVEAKSRIWRSMIPALDEQTAATLAERYDFSGGQIENIARKRTVDTILRGEEPSFEQLDEYCRSEMLGQSERLRRRIGF